MRDYAGARSAPVLVISEAVPVLVKLNELVSERNVSSMFIGGVISCPRSITGEECVTDEMHSFCY